MNIYDIPPVRARLAGNPYVGRGILCGRSADGQKAVAAYFIMGRSQNSRNRVFAEREGAVFTEPFDAARVEDPSLIIYAALRDTGDRLIVTNGDQTDTIFEGLRAGKSMREALRARRFEPDAPNLTPRISAMLTFGRDAFTYEMSILKAADPAGTACCRFHFDYEPLPGLGHFLHTYVTDGDPLPTFQGEPERVAIGNDIDALTREIWENLDASNRISLYVRTVDLGSGRRENRLVNANRREGI